MTSPATNAGEDMSEDEVKRLLLIFMHLVNAVDKKTLRDWWRSCNPRSTTIYAFLKTVLLVSRWVLLLLLPISALLSF